MHSFKTLLFFLFLISPALAQQTVITKPFVVPNTNNVSSTISTTNNFQTAIVANSNRTSCILQNNSSNTMWIFFGAATSATKARSIKLSGGQAISCIAGSIVLRDEVAVTGTSGDEFYAAYQ